MTRLAEEHPVLLASADRLVTQLRCFSERLQPGRVAHMQHDDHADRARSLALYLEGAVHLVQAELYPAAFAVLRAALEHHVLDLLVFLGRRFVQRTPPLDDKTWQEWQAALESREEGTENIVSWKRSRNGAVEIVRSGLHAAGVKARPRASAISIYYFLIKEFNPFHGKLSQQDHLTTDFMEPSLHRQWAKTSQEQYNHLLRWASLRANLTANRLFAARDILRLDVHYGFLSAFAHPTLASHELVYGRNYPSEIPRYDHFSSELALLYVNVFAAAELRALRRMSTRTPRVSLRNWREVEGDLNLADRITAHLWFPPRTSPHLFDRVQEANHRGLKNGRLVEASKRKRPDELRDHDVRYYRNPLERLVRMHSSFNELTGFGYLSPWEREDARFRT